MITNLICPSLSFPSRSVFVLFSYLSDSVRSRFRFVVLAQLRIQILLDGVQKLFSMQVHAFFHVFQSVNAGSQIFRHFSRFDHIYARFLNGTCEFFQSLISIKFRSMFQPASPSEYASHRVRTGLLAFLIFSIVPGHSAVRGFASIVFPSGQTRTLVIRPSDPYPCATISDWTSPS